MLIVMLSAKKFLIWFFDGGARPQGAWDPEVDNPKTLNCSGVYIYNTN